MSKSLEDMSLDELQTRMTELETKIELHRAKAEKARQKCRDVESVFNARVGRRSD